MLVMNKTLATRRSIRGLSLVELMVALAIGLVVIGAVLVSYLSSSSNSQQSTSLAQMSEDATVALNVLRGQIAMVGYSRPIGTITATNSAGNPVEVLNRAYKGFNNDSNDFITGCDGGLGGFVDNRAKDLNISDLTCPTSATANTDPDSIAIAYEADVDNTFRVGTAPNEVPSDCLGQELLPRTETGIAATTYVASNRFFIGTNGTTGQRELYCQGNGGVPLPLPGNDTINANSTQQPLVENIVDLQITYGIADTQVTGGNTTVLKEARRYLTATQIRALATAVPPSTDLWNRVVSVRICVEVRSAKPAAPGEANLNLGGYVNCQGGAQRPTDGHLHRSFWTTVVLHNRIS